jgi:hypothetical protein
MMQTDWDTLCDYTDELMATGRYPARHEAMLEAQRRNPHLDPTPPGMKPMRPVMHSGAGAVTSGGNAEQQLNAAAKQIAAARRITFAQAYVEVLNSNPALYVAYLREHEAALRGRHG